MRVVNLSRRADFEGPVLHDVRGGDLVGLWEFSWQALPETLRRLLPAEYAGENGRVPDADLARAAWTEIRDRWLLRDDQRIIEFVALLDELGVARTTRSQTKSDADFLRALRNTAGLRHAVVRYLLQLGSQGGRPLESVADDEESSGIPSADFAPRNFNDFTRLAGFNELSWGYWLLSAFNAVEDLLPGESIILGMELDGPANSGHPGASVSFMFARLNDDAFEVIAGPESFLPGGVHYGPLRQRLIDLGWTWAQQEVPVGQYPWADGIDDALVLAQQTFRSIFFIDDPARAFTSDEMTPPGGMLPAAPLPHEVISPSGPEELISVVDSIVRAMGGHIIADVDATTHGFRWRDWSGWIHANADEAVLDVVVIALDHSSSSVELEATHIVDLQTRVLRYGRIVVSGGQTLVAASFPCQAFKGGSIQALLVGVMTDAAACVGRSRHVPDVDRSIGGYL